MDSAKQFVLGRYPEAAIRHVAPELYVLSGAPEISASGVSDEQAWNAAAEFLKRRAESASTHYLASKGNSEIGGTVECPNRWLSRPDAMAVAMAITKSESWSRRLLLTVAAVGCRVTRLADRWVATLEAHRDDRPISPKALAYLKAHATGATFNQVLTHSELEKETARGGWASVSPRTEVMRINLLTVVLGAGYVAERNWRNGMRVAARHYARLELADRQRKAVGTE